MERLSVRPSLKCKDIKCHFWAFYSTPIWFFSPSFWKFLRPLKHPIINFEIFMPSLCKKLCEMRTCSNYFFCEDNWISTVNTNMKSEQKMLKIWYLRIFMKQITINILIANSEKCRLFQKDCWEGEKVSGWLKSFCNPGHNMLFLFI